MSAPSLPKSLLSTSRAEYYDAEGREPSQCSLPLTVKVGLTDEPGQLPSDLIGSVYIAAPAGAADSPKLSGTDTILPTQDGWTHLLNGDGMIYRIDFDESHPKISSRLVTTVSYYADKIAHTKYPLLKFITYGIARLSEFVGICNQANTAFLPIPSSPGKPERLLVTWDMGRPMEIDPLSLRTIAPVGLNRDWRSTLQVTVANMPVQGIMSSAHPVVSEAGEVITLNVVKSVEGILGLKRLFSRNFELLVEELPRLSITRPLLRLGLYLLREFIEFVVDTLQLLGIAAYENVYFLRWNSKTDVCDSWKVVLPNKQSIRIKQTTHQMGLTKDYIVFADTAFKMIFGDLLPDKDSLRELKESDRKLYTWLRFNREFLTFPLLPYTSLYIVRRDQLENVLPGGEIVAKKVVLKNAAIAHYRVDYDNTDDKIILHAALNQETDFAEFIHSDDESALGDPQVEKRMREMAGIFVDGMEVNRPATYIIDAQTGKVDSEATISQEEAVEHTWSMGVYTSNEGNTTEKYEDIYWSSFGAWPETFPEAIVDLYKTPQVRRSSEFREFESKVSKGIPTSICRIHIDRTQGKIALSVEDSYSFPEENSVAYFGNSPQFVPKEGLNGSTEGYVVCVVHYSDQIRSSSDLIISGESWSANTEIWVFDATNLAQGPLYRMSHAKLNMGMTIHTTWLKEVASPENPRFYNVREDFEDRVAAAVNHHTRKDPYEANQLAQLFEEIYVKIDEEQEKAPS